MMPASRPEMRVALRGLRGGVQSAVEGGGVFAGHRRPLHARFEVGVHCAQPWPQQPV